MKRVITVFLSVANIAALYFLLHVVSPVGPSQVKAEDLLSRPVDLDGDGNCTLAEELTFRQLLKDQPLVIDTALKCARFLPDGSIDLSNFLMQFGLKGCEATLFRDGEIVKVRYENCGTKE